MSEPAALRLADLPRCYEGAIPAVIATASADGTPNVSYLSCVRLVDDQRVALSNQFFTKTSRNLAANPRATLLLIDPATHVEYRLALVYERTERRGETFERLMADVDHVAALANMSDVFRLRSADICRVVDITVIDNRTAPPPAPEAVVDDRTRAIGELCARLARCGDLDSLVDTTVDGLAQRFGFRFVSLLLLDESGKRLYTIASHGYDREGVGSEVAVGEGIAGVAAAQCRPARVGNLLQLAKYGRAIVRSFEDQGGVGPGREIPLPAADGVQSRMAVPAMSRGQLVGVVVVEDERYTAFDEADEAAVIAVATVVGGAIEAMQSAEQSDAAVRAAAIPGRLRPADRPRTRVRFFEVDGSVFFDGDYVIKGVAGRILWSLVNQYQLDGRTEFTNREVRLDRSLAMPELRDNFESRLIMLKRRLDERTSPVRIVKTGRGRFDLEVDTDLWLERA